MRSAKAVAAESFRRSVQLRDSGVFSYHPGTRDEPPKKPGRPSHSYHTYSMAGARLVFDVDVCAGNEHTSKHCAPGLWALLDRIPRDSWPTLLRGDAGFGQKPSKTASLRSPMEPIMREAERRGVAYLFKLR